MMHFSHRPIPWRTSLLASAILMLSACGGVEKSSPDGSSTDTSGATVTPVTLTGTLTDSVVIGVSYAASPSGLSGVTDSQGHFSYRSGDSVSFTIGSLNLGTVTGMDTITPIELADDHNSNTDDADKVINRLVLLQSLDSDGNANNGLTIEPEVASATTTTGFTLDFSLDPATFLGSGGLSLLINASNTSKATDARCHNSSGDTISCTTATAVTISGATAHFRTQFMSKITGVWQLKSINGATATEYDIYRFDGDVSDGDLDDTNNIGRYLMGSAPMTGTSGTTLTTGAGAETGTFDWNASTGGFTATLDCSGFSQCTVDSNGSKGFSGMSGITAYFSDDALMLLDARGTASTSDDQLLQLERISNTESDLAGAWALGASSVTTPMLVFLSDSKYLLMTPFSTAGDTTCSDSTDSSGNTIAYASGATAGVELGSYSSYNGTYMTLNAPAYDTTGCSGLWGNGSTPVSNLYGVTVGVRPGSSGANDDKLATSLASGSMSGLFYRVPAKGELTGP